ncbi:oxygen-independent coproporphyrinogen III oxidase [Leisingera sp. M527]|uniref:oxygen-independent coproporphyrinogen III oxidase n=1 Tax=Leisingera sp. M527 TaxID=2867014 RepID=UPI0021A71BE7|nr:oxygen-independent coproporphyrinogen III oxidase [Leisingera sp. M527]UWQ33490.1 oxygen-independent coproporphyrinogen III oxidase [Leisingera sp. M527]
MDQKPQLAELGLFDAKVPRYTSYPTAPHFGNAVDPARFSNWVSKISPGSSISMYVHVPFCRRLCWFCACRTQGTRSDAPVEAYVQVLKAEIALLRQQLPEGVTLSRLHWGGGTPTILNVELIRDLASTIAEAIPLAPRAEFSVEIDPNEIGGRRLEALAGAGMTHATVGVQDFDSTIQQAIGRIQSFESTRTAIEQLHSHGIAGLNADILYGLPHQTPAGMTESVQKLVSLTPGRVAVYGYAHVPWMAGRQSMIRSDTLPTPEARLQLFETARRLFLWDGYREVGIDHFARPGDGLAVAQRTGRLRRSFQGYTNDPAEVLIGIGASAISRFPQGYAQNAPGTSAYIRAIRDGQFATARGHGFSGEDLLRARLIEALMCDFRISREEILSRFAVPAARLEKMFAEAGAAFPGMLSVSAQGLAIREEARPLTRMIARSFDAYDLSTAAHSTAV